MVRLRLYVSGQDADTRRAIAAVEALRAEIGGAQTLDFEVLDVLLDPAGAERDRVTITPTLVHAGPDAVSKVVGELPDPQALVRHLGLDPLLSGEPAAPA